MRILIITFAAFIASCQVNSSCIKWHAGKTSGLIDCLKNQIKNHVIKEEELTGFTPLSNEELKQLRDDGKIDDNLYHELLTYAYEAGHPLIFREAKEVVLPSDYSINLLWIHKAKPEAQNHFMGNDDNLLQEKVIEPISSWQKKQPEAFINFWYDGKMINDLVIQNTRKILQENGINVDRVKFRDVNEIDLVKENTDLYEAKIPVYFRVDLSKALIADHVARKDGIIAVVTDLDVKSISRSHLFDDKTLQLLKLKGHLFGQSGGVGFENSFYILSPNGEALFDGKKYIDWHRANVINEAIKEGKLKKEKIQPDYVYLIYSHYGANLYQNFVMAVITRKLPFYLLQKNKPLLFPRSQFLGYETYKPELLEKLKEMLQ